MCETAFAREEGKSASFLKEPHEPVRRGVAYLVAVHTRDYLQEPPIDHAA